MFASRNPLDERQGRGGCGSARLGSPSRLMDFTAFSFFTTPVPALRRTRGGVQVKQQTDHKALCQRCGKNVLPH